MDPFPLGLRKMIEPETKKIYDDKIKTYIQILHNLKTLYLFILLMDEGWGWQFRF